MENLLWRPICFSTICPHVKGAIQRAGPRRLRGDVARAISRRGCLGSIDGQPHSRCAWDALSCRFGTGPPSAGRARRVEVNECLDLGHRGARPDHARRAREILRLDRPTALLGRRRQPRLERRAGSATRGARSFERHAESLSCRPKGALMSRPSRSLQSRRRRALASALAARTRRCSSLIFVVRSTVLRSGGRLPGHPAHGMAQAFAHPRTHPPGARGARAYPAGSR